MTPATASAFKGLHAASLAPAALDLKTKEFIAIAASLMSGCKGCLEGHLKKAKREGATSDEIAELIAIVLGVNAATIVDRSDIANYHLGGLFERPEGE